MVRSSIDITRIMGVVKRQRRPSPDAQLHVRGCRRPRTTRPTLAVRDTDRGHLTTLDHSSTLRLRLGALHIDAMASTRQSDDALRRDSSTLGCTAAPRSTAFRHDVIAASVRARRVRDLGADGRRPGAMRALPPPPEPFDDPMRRDRGRCPPRRTPMRTDRRAVNRVRHER